VAEVGAGKSPVWAHGEGRLRWPRRAVLPARKAMPHLRAGEALGVSAGDEKLEKMEAHSSGGHGSDYGNGGAREGTRP
jgi:hypothetical protein